MLIKIEQWIDQVLSEHSGKAQACNVFSKVFQGFYSSEALENCFFVIVDKIPKPDFPEIYEAGFGGFISMDVDGITYKNTYFIKRGYENDLALHFHELVHVQQWRYLGAQGFLQRYMQEYEEYGYDEMPLEMMAYSLESSFKEKGKPFDIHAYVQSQI